MLHDTPREVFALQKENNIRLLFYFAKMFHSNSLLPDFEHLRQQNIRQNFIFKPRKL